MTDSETTLQPSINDAPGSAAAAPIPPAPTASAAEKKQAASFALLWFFVVLIVAALFFGGFYAWQQTQSQQQLIEELRTQLDQKIQETEIRQQVLEDTLDKEFVEQQSSIQTSLNEMAEQLDNNNARLLSLSSVNRDDWKLQEAQYLLRLADQRILLEKDSQNALALALSADDVLREVDQADLMAVRKLLAEEISVLKMVGVIDREGIYLRLSAVSNQIDAIPFITPLGAQEALLEEEITPDNETFKQKVTRYFYAMLHKLSSYVRVRDHGKTINAVLPPSEQKYLQQNLRLMLEQAQVALLRNEEGIYQESLVKAQNWINQYYTLKEKATAVLEELQSLLQEEVAPDLTNFSNSSAALTEYIAKRQKMAAARRGVR